MQLILISRRTALMAFMLLYLAVNQCHQYQHLGHYTAAAEANLAAGAADEIRSSRPGLPCPGDFSTDSQSHQACNCSISHFTVQQRYESQILLATHELSYLPLDKNLAQHYPHGVNPPPRFS